MKTNPRKNAANADDKTIAAKSRKMKLDRKAKSTILAICPPNENTYDQKMIFGTEIAATTNSSSCR